MSVSAAATDEEMVGLTLDDFVALQASRHSERQLTTAPSLRIKRSIYFAVVLGFCVFTLKRSHAWFAVMRKEYVNDDGYGTTGRLGRGANETMSFTPLESWNSSSGGSQIIDVLMNSNANQSNESEHKLDSPQSMDGIEKQNDSECHKTDKIVQLQPNNSKASRHIWIDAVSYAEGIAGWKTSLLELLHLAQALNATLVEPCMTSGRLGSCGGEFNIPVSDLFDLEEYKVPSIGREFPMLMSYDNYQAALDESDLDIGMIKVCLLNNRRMNRERRCPNNTTHISEMGQHDLIHIVREANEDNFILHLEDYWRGSLRKLGLLMGMEFPYEEEFGSKILPFHSEHVKFVDDLLQRGNIEIDNFSAIHWRAEKVGMNYTRCARAVNNVKQIILKRNMSSNNITETGGESTHKFVLLSSLNEDSDKMWAESRMISNKKSMREALKYLLHDNGFVKIDSLLEKEHKLGDSGMLAIYDLIIAAKAKNFASCVRDGEIGCTEASRSLCEECNHIGKFGRMAALFRQEKATMECWPTE